MMTGNRTGRDKQLREKADSPSPRLQADHSRGGCRLPKTFQKILAIGKKTETTQAPLHRLSSQVPEKVRFPKVCSQAEGRHTYPWTQSILLKMKTALQAHTNAFVSYLQYSPAGRQGGPLPLPPSPRYLPLLLSIIS